MVNFNSDYSLYGDFLNNDPQGQRANFFGRLPQNLSQNEFAYASSLFQPTFNRYLGQLGQQILGGETPTRTFSQVLMDFNPQRELLRAPTGVLNTQHLTSPTRFLYG